MRLQKEKIYHNQGQLCPSCGSTDKRKKRGLLVKKQGKYGVFLSCSLFPDCMYSCKDDDLSKVANAFLPRKQRRGQRGKKSIKRIMKKEIPKAERIEWGRQQSHIKSI